MNLPMGMFQQYSVDIITHNLTVLHQILSSFDQHNTPGVKTETKSIQMKFKKATTQLPLILAERQSTSQEETATAW